MTTTMKAKKPDMIEELAKLEGARAAAQAQVDEFGRIHKQKQDAALALLDLRGEHLNRAPTEFNADGSSIEGTEAAKIDAEIKALGRVDFTAEIEHAKRIETVAKQEVHRFIEANYAEIVERGVAEDQLAADDVNSAAAALVEALRNYIGRHGDNTQLTIPVADVNGRHVPGLEAAGSLLRVIESINLPAPTPRLPNA